MAAIDSRTAGVLPPLTDAGNDPEKVIKAYVAAVTGLDAALVRRRWYPKPLERPSLSTDWCAVGLSGHEIEGTPALSHSDSDFSAADGGITRVSEIQRLTFQASFYGPNAQLFADRFRLGVCVGQNNEYLKSKGMTLVSLNPRVVRIPELFGAVWADRYDVDFVVGRALAHEFGVRSIHSADSFFVVDR